MYVVFVFAAIVLVPAAFAAGWVDNDVTLALLLMGTALASLALARIGQANEHHEEVMSALRDEGATPAKTNRRTATAR